MRNKKVNIFIIKIKAVKFGSFHNTSGNPRLCQQRFIQNCPSREQFVYTCSESIKRCSIGRLFVCSDDTVISSFLICDGHADCSNGGDESMCTRYIPLPVPKYLCKIIKASREKDSYTTYLDILGFIFEMQHL